MSTGYDIYKKNLMLHGENARLRKALEAFEKDMEYKLHLSSLVASYEKKLQKLTNALSRTEKQKQKRDELHKQIAARIEELEKKVEDIINKVDKLSDKQKDLAEKTEKAKTKSARKTLFIQSPNQRTVIVSPIGSSQFW